MRDSILQGSGLLLSGAGSAGSTQWKPLRYADRDPELDHDPSGLDPSVSDVGGLWTVEASMIASRRLEEAALWRWRLPDDIVDAIRDQERSVYILIRLRDVTRPGTGTGGPRVCAGLVLGPAGDPVGYTVGVTQRTITEDVRAIFVRSTATAYDDTGAITTWNAGDCSGGGIVHLDPTEQGPRAVVAHAWAETEQSSEIGPIGAGQRIEDYGDDPDATIGLLLGFFQTQSGTVTWSFRPEYAIVTP